MGLVRDEKRNACVELPIKHRDAFAESKTREEILSSAKKLGYRALWPEYLFQAGMPDDVKKAYQEAIGINDE